MSRVSEKQISYIKALIASHEEPTPTYAWNRLGGIEAYADRYLDSRSASQIIDWLKTLPYKKAERVSQPVSEALKDGMYRLPDGTIYKVQVAVHGSGNLYAKKLTLFTNNLGDLAAGDTLEPTYDVSFEYAPGAMRLLRPEYRMTLEAAKEFGALYGTCCVCGRTLTREESIEAGIGPVCAGKF